VALSAKLRVLQNKLSWPRAPLHPRDTTNYLHNAPNKPAYHIERRNQTSSHGNVAADETVATGTFSAADSVMPSASLPPPAAAGEKAGSRIGGVSSVGLSRQGTWDGAGRLNNLQHLKRFGQLAAITSTWKRGAWFLWGGVGRTQGQKGG